LAVGRTWAFASCDVTAVVGFVGSDVAGVLFTGASGLAALVATVKKRYSVVCLPQLVSGCRDRGDVPESGWSIVDRLQEMLEG
jgi:hypothetical protein